MFNSIVNTGFQTVELKSTHSSGTPAASVQAEEKVVADASTAPAESTEEQAAASDKAELETAVTKLNDYVQNIRRTLSFTIEESTGNTVISVYDSETEELIRQIPPKETLQLAAAIEQSGRTLLLKEQA